MAELADLLARMGRCRTVGEALTLLADETDVPAQLAGRQRSEAEQDLAVTAFEEVHVILEGLVAPEEAEYALATLRGSVSSGALCVGVDDPSGEGQGVADGAAAAARPGAVPGGGARRAARTIETTKGVAQSDWLEQERRIFYVGLTRAIEASSFVAELSPPRPTAPPRPAPAPAARAGRRGARTRTRRSRSGT